MKIWQEVVSQEIRMVGVSGRLDQNLTPDLENLLLVLLEDGTHYFVVNLTEVNYINSGGLRCLVTAWRQAHQHGGDLVLCGLNDRIAKVFSLVGFDKVFRIYDDCGEAKKGVTGS